MKKVLLFVAFLATSCTGISAQNGEDKSLNPIDGKTISVGTLPGGFNISPTGAATYTIPLDLPPGRAGMTPEIALSYNSQTSDGVMGKGWGIAGWSYIERVNETQYYDDRNGSIDFADDVFSWDGNRLIKIDGGINENYYRTEVDNVAQIKMMNANKENTYFIIHTKEGLIKYYGGTTDSRQVSKKDENPAIRYHLNKIEDRKGNYIQYNYERIVGTGELYLKKIKYTLHGQLPNATPYEVDFVYSSIHPKYERFYLFSHGTEKYEYQITKKLDAIKIIWNGVTIKTYTINYVGGGLFETKHFVKNIVLKGLNGTQEYNPTTFDWKFNAASEGIYNNVFIDEEVENFHVTGFNYGSGDFNGDGVTDIIESGLFSMSKEGTFLRVSKNMASIKISDDYFLSPTKFINCDIDGDGRDELFIARSGSLKCYRFHVSGTTITPEDMGEKDITFVAQGDFTGDALADIIVKNNSLYQLHRGNSEFFNKFWNSPFIITNPVFPEGENTFRTGDFNGDGKSDFANFNKNSENTFGVWTLKFNTSPSTYSVENMEFQDFQGISLTAMILVAFDVGDFNGDGKDDMLLTIKYTNGNTETNICYAYGKGWQVNAVTGLGTYYSYFQSEKFGHVVTDLNNDGIADVATYYFTFPASGKVKVNFGKYFKYPGAQGGFQTKSVEHVHNYFPTWSSVKTDPIIMGDFSGNGEKDICYILNFEEWRQSEKLPVSTRRYAYTLTDEEVGSDLIVKATNGLGVQNTLLYSKYNPIQYTYTSYPVLRFMSPFYVVSSVKISNGAGGFFPATTYDYTGMQAHAQGKGLLGFQKINVTDNLAGVKSVTTYNLYINNNMHFFIYPADIKQTALSNNQLLSQTTNKLSVKNLVSRYPKVFYPVPICSFTIQNDLNGTYIGSKKSIQSLDDLDAYGNSTKTIMLKDEWVWNINDPNTAYGWRTTTENQYNQIELQNWLVGRPTQTTTTRFHKENGEHTDITIQNFQYYEPAEAQWPLLNNVTTTPNGSQLLTTQVVYDYDMFGNIIKETLKAPNDNELNDRITHYEYFEDNYYDARFMTKKIVEAPGDNYQTYYWYNQSCGYMTYHKDISGLETTFQYDDMGNHYSTNHPDGNATKHYVYWSSGNSHAPPGAKYHTSNCKLTTQYQQWGLTLTFYDALGRELRTATQSLNGLYVYTDKTYDNKGRLFKVFEPYFKGTSPILYTMMEYDHLGRLETKTNTDGTIITTTYNGRTSKTTNLETGIWSDKTVNAAGIIDLASDISGTTINYNYDGAGRLLLTHAAGVFTTIEYDDAGNRYKLFDPDAGTIESHYNAFGEIKYQKDGQGNEYTMTYDGIGRLLAKFAMQGDFEEIGFQYGNNSSQHGFGQLKEQSVTYPISDNLPFVFYDYTYDRLGRVVAKEESVGNKTFTFTYQYNPYHGQLEYTTYPSGYQIRNIYNTRGYLYQVVEGSKVLWQANQMNARGQLTNYELGNGLVTIKQFDQYGYISAIFTPGVQSNGYNFDAASGNLTSQGNYMKMWWEHYTYDDLLKSRLEGWSISSQVNGSITYLQNGNIDNKSDVTTPSGKYDYASAKPHAVSRVVGPTPQYLQKAKQQTITYTTFNKVKEITQQFYAPAVDRHRLKFNYGPDQARIKTEYCYVMVDGTEILRKTKYFLGNYEIEIDDAGNERKLHYLIAGDGIFAIVEKKNEGNAQIHYIHKNYLGSFDAITNSSGAIEELLSFDPWGRRRNPSSGIVDDGIYSMFDSGFTGHEHLDEFGLINMNGRLYDPVLARFLSPDPYVQAPDNLQNHNRYSYALNNPLRYTDPSGEWIHLAIGAFIGGIINWATHGAQFNAAGLGYFGVGALAGGLAAGIGAGIGGLVSGAGSFSFSVPSSLAQWGFLNGAAAGGAAGLTNGLISGTGNSLVSGTNIGESLARGLESAWKQGLTGAAFGGISAGIDAVAHGRNFLTGHAKGSMYVSAERLSINVPEQRAELNTGGMSAELDDLNTHIIDVARTTETNQSTISSFSIDEGQLEGYFLEPAGPSSAVEGSGLRIQEGIYEIGSYSSTKFDNHFELLNVPGRSQILIHGGTGPLNTSGCLVIGNNVGLNSISGWQEMMGQLRTYINSNGGTRNFYIIIQ